MSDFFVERVRPGERVLDIGSGKGALAPDLVVRGGARVVGVDHDRGRLAFARPHYAHQQLEFRLGNVLVERVASSATPRALLNCVPLYQLLVCWGEIRAVAAPR